MSVPAKEMFNKMDSLELVQTYGYWLNELKNRGMIRTRNVLGELGEYFAIKHYNESPELPNLSALDIGTKGVDAKDTNGARYSIKATTSATTGVFNGLNDPDATIPQEQKFEYVIIVRFDVNFSLKAIYELNWTNFLKHKKWNPSKRSWNLTITKALKKDAKMLFEQ